MMNFEEIKKYWEDRAANDSSAQSTTQDYYLREIEFNVLSERIDNLAPKSVADIGCGDGRTTSRLANKFPKVFFTGFDYSSSMIENANNDIISKALTNIHFEQLDICEGVEKSFDLIYTTRCLINLPTWDYQKVAINNIHKALNMGGVYLMIENFIEGQENFNRLRKDYGLTEIPIRRHNFFFHRELLLDYVGGLFEVEEDINISSAYYLASRVLYSKICAETGQQPDYFDDHHRFATGLPFTGEFGPVRLIAQKKHKGFYMNHQEQVKSNIIKLGTDSELRENSIAWVHETAQQNYSYNFSWLGRPIIQYPQDMVAMQELIWEVKPDLIIETGIAHGGSLIMNASLLAMLDYCDAIENGQMLDPNKPKRRVLGVDIDIRAHNRMAIEAHPMANRIDMVEGSSIAKGIIAQVYEYSKNYKKILISLDSNHTHDHVLAELEAYAPLTSIGSYCVVFDTIIEDMPEDMFPDRPWGPGNNPKTAVWEYLKTHPEFEIDKSIENKLLITVAPDGYLKRVN